MKFLFGFQKLFLFFLRWGIMQAIKGKLRFVLANLLSHLASEYEEKNERLDTCNS